ncbi:NAD-dependent epimerase/dehydratase family protein [Labedaea rhizosphaerae]|uniref:Nucleoside-diphosphate-sugar epimerase n=1 Tax=Labedaea rhizosphaerae TaxID=598644 RepID=A0A4R6S555_LABRH|nr:NAD-dependent epimerase/dehydratase family protein [Labedaea rhizosphaerae]TDP93876.1 nucleoside-diphosphate-sugar epimerase [Labedaea rhizosphaerae]
MKVLVTGSAGIFGTHLVRRLARSAGEPYEVIGLDIRDAEPIPGVRQVIGDVRDPDMVGRLTDGADAVVHCAAALPSHDEADVWSVDVDGTSTVLAAARRCGVSRFVHISSTAVYGVPEVQPTPENHPFVGVDPYNRAKIAAERLCGQYRDEGMCLPILRPKTFLGPERLGLFAMLFEWASEGRGFPVLAGGRVRCQMLDVADLCDVTVEALHRPADAVNDVFNVAASEFGLLRDEFQAVLDAAGHGRRVITIPARPAIGVLRALEKLHISPVYKRLARKLLHDSYVSIDRARSRLGFDPKFSNTESLLRTYDWYLEHARGTQHTGRSHGEPWRQGALKLVKAAF